MSSKIHIVTNETPSNTNILYLDTSNEDYPFIAYKKDDGDAIESVIEGDTYDRPIHCSELFRLLLSMNPGVKFTLNNYSKDLYYQIPYPRFEESIIPKTLLVTIPNISGRSEPEVFQDRDNGPGIDEIRYVKVCDSDNWNLYPEETEEIEDLIRELEADLDNKKLRVTGQFASDIKTGINVFDLVEKTTYTDTLDFNDLLMKVVDSDISCMAEVSVSYTIGSKIYKASFVFKPFHYISDDSSVDMPFMIRKFKYIQADYVDGVLRVIPVSNSVDECIIDSCTVTYGNL